MLVARSRLLAATALCAAAIAGVAHGCGSEERPPASPNTGGDSGSITGGSGGAIWGGGTGSGGAPSGGGGTTNLGGGSGCGGPAPAEAPADWEQFPGYCECPIYFPGAKGKLPDPIEWEPCPAPAPSGATCRRMKTPWTSLSLPLPVGNVFWADAATGKAYLQFGRNRVNDDASSKYRYRLVADVEGPVLNAFYQDTLACAVSTKALHGGRYAFWVGPGDATGPKQTEGVIAGKIGSPPDTVVSFPAEETLHTGWRVSSEWLIRWKGGIYARPWGSTNEITVQVPTLDPEGLSAYGPRAVGEAIFWEVGGLTYNGVMSWTQATGGRSLIRYPGDFTQGAGNFGTDGVDMTWTYGEGKQPSGTEYPKRSVMTAPFTTDPAIVKQKAKRLRSDPAQIGLDWFVVGCGYAARIFYEDIDAGTGASGDLLVVRLSDGVSWIFDAPPLSSGFRVLDALGLTCQEVFAHAQFPDDAQTIIRLRLDSLGPGIPPD